MSRSRWFVLLGPPLIAVAAVASAALPEGSSARSVAGTLPVPRALIACPPGADRRAGPALPGTWWRQVPILDRSGSLVGWSLTAGDAGARRITMSLPPAASVSGPEGGRVIVSSDDGSRSLIRTVDAAGGCEQTIEVGRAIARRAIADPAGVGVLVHLIDRRTRSDLGTWRIDPDGSRRILLEPVTVDALQAAGIDRVWATDLRPSPDGSRLAVQSCDPDACVTRVLDLATGRVVLLADRHGRLLGFAGERVVTMAACHGLPCGVLAWNAVTRTAEIVERSTVGAVISRDGRIVAAVRSPGGRLEAVVIDAATGKRRLLGSLDAAFVPAGGAGATGGVETPVDAVALLVLGGHPAILDLDPSTDSPASRPTEVQP